MQPAARRRVSLQFTTKRLELSHLLPSNDKSVSHRPLFVRAQYESNVFRYVRVDVMAPGYVAVGAKCGTGIPGIDSRMRYKTCCVVTKSAFQSSPPEAHWVAPLPTVEIVPRCRPDGSKIQTPPGAAQ